MCKTYNFKDLPSAVIEFPKNIDVTDGMIHSYILASVKQNDGQNIIEKDKKFVVWVGFGNSMDVLIDAHYRITNGSIEMEDYGVIQTCFESKKFVINSMTVGNDYGKVAVSLVEDMFSDFHISIDESLDRSDVWRRKAMVARWGGCIFSEIYYKDGKNLRTDESLFSALGQKIRDVRKVGKLATNSSELGCEENMEKYNLLAQGAPVIITITKNGNRYNLNKDYTQLRAFVRQPRFESNGCFVGDYGRAAIFELRGPRDLFVKLTERFLLNRTATRFENDGYIIWIT